MSYKKRKKLWSKIALLLCVALLIGNAESAMMSMAVQAAPSDTQSQIDQTEKDKDTLEGQLEQENQNIAQLEQELADLQKELSNLNAELQEIVGNLNDLEEQIGAKEQEIAETQERLNEAKEKEKWQQENMVTQVRCIYERREDSYLSMLLSAGSLADLLDMAYYIERVMAYGQQQMDSFIEYRQTIEEQEEQLKREKNELQVLQLLAEDERKNVSDLMAQVQAAVAKHSNLVDAAEQKAKDYEKAIKEKEETLEALKKKLAEEIALSQAAANAQWRDISEVSFSDDDLYLLANLIYCEAGGEPYVGQVAVGSVVMNRVLSSKFPDTIIGVIYQKGQFAPVASGRLALALSVDKATDSCYRAAEEAMSGITNVGNCLFFRTPIPGLNGIRIGGHVFY